MNQKRFDNLARSLVAADRGTTRRAAAAALLALIAPVAGDRAAAKKKRRNKRRNKRCKGNKKKCGGKRCVNLATNGANCGACGNACASGECVRGACTCASQTECPLGCYCTPRIAGEGVCFGLDGTSALASCDSDGDCPFGALCLINNLCSRPCRA